MKKYPDLFELLRRDEQARAYFASLPEYVRTSITDRPDGINSLESLQAYAENFLSGN